MKNSSAKQESRAQSWSVGPQSSFLLFYLHTFHSSCPSQKPLQLSRCGGAVEFPRSPTAPHTWVGHMHPCAPCLTYGGEWHESLDKKAGGWSELVGFLNQDVKAHLRKRKQSTWWCCGRLREEGAGQSRSRENQRRLLPQLHPRPKSSASSLPDASELQCGYSKPHAQPAPLVRDRERGKHQLHTHTPSGEGKRNGGWLLLEYIICK